MIGPMARAGAGIALLFGAAVVAGLGAPAARAIRAEKELALRYAPVVRLVKPTQPCGHGEHVEPINVNAVLGNPDVALHGPWSGSNIVKVAPTARDLAPGLFESHLDYPGNALSPGCTYDTWERQITKGSQPTTYARVVTERRHPRQLALQYWFFYIFNNFNDKHEGDWEMIQLNFDAATAAQALRVRPYEVGYSQHEGAERALWGDKKLELVGGTHPVVYPALGSHANYFGSYLFLGRSAAQGVGCDKTLGPSKQLRPVVVVVPTARQAYVRALPWLGYQGHWGEEHSGFYDGPTGPNTKLQWTQPITWADTTWRDHAFAIPAVGAFGSTATGFFCGVVARGSNLLTAVTGNPSPVLFALVVVAGFVLWLISRTEWQPVDPLPVRRRRPAGSIVGSAARLYASHLRLFLGIGLLFIPLGFVMAVIQFVAFRVTGLNTLADSAGPSNAFVGGLALFIGVLVTAVGLAVIQAATAAAMASFGDEQPLGALAAYRAVFDHWRPLFGAIGLAAVVVAVLSLTTVGVLVALWLFVRWSVTAQAVMLEGRGARDALRRSAHLVRGNWFRVAALTLFVTVLAYLLGPLAGALLLFVTSASFDFVNMFSALVDTLALPYVAIASTYLYYDLELRQEERAESAEAPLVTAGT
jgi:hypothetical protein